MTSGPIAFTGSPIDRADHIRSDPDALARATSASARVLRLEGLDPTVGPDAGLVWESLADVRSDSELVFLGLDGARACFAEVPSAPPAGTGAADPRLWQVMLALDPGELATYGAARSLVDWHTRHRFCSRCGGGTALAKGGWQRNCTDAACRAEHFPRVDPVTIMLVEHDGDLLLGRQPRFPKGSYSALAGFVEPGESIEEAVAREVLEEAGLRARDVRYVASQPWPFPSSLMIACHAIAAGRELTIDRTELEDARWFSRAEVADALAAVRRNDAGAAFRAPPPHAVAHHLLDWWLAQEARVEALKPIVTRAPASPVR